MEDGVAREMRGDRKRMHESRGKKCINSDDLLWTFSVLLEQPIRVSGKDRTQGEIVRVERVEIKVRDGRENVMIDSC